MPEAPIARHIHQALDVHRRFTTQIAFDHQVRIDSLADTHDLIFRQLVYAPLRWDCQPLANLPSSRSPNTMNVGEGDTNRLLRRNVHT